MNPPSLRLLIQEKLAAGRLPHDDISRLWAGPSTGETCDGCDATVTEAQLLIKNSDAAGGKVQLHVACFHLWDVERSVREPELQEPGIAAAHKIRNLMCSDWQVTGGSS